MTLLHLLLEHRFSLCCLASQLSLVPHHQPPQSPPSHRRPLQLRNPLFCGGVARTLPETHRRCCHMPRLRGVAIPAAAGEATFAEVNKGGITSTTAAVTSFPQAILAKSVRHLAITGVVDSHPSHF